MATPNHGSWGCYPCIIAPVHSGNWSVHPLAARLLRPLRLAAGRFAIDPVTEQLVWRFNDQMRQQDLRSSLFYKAAKLIASDEIEGDYLEFGVYLGGSFSTAYHAIGCAFDEASSPGPWNTERECQVRRAIGDRMRFFAFDSFEGLPASDGTSKDFVEGKFSASERTFLGNIAANGVDLGRARTVPGFFSAQLLEDARIRHRIEHASIVHIDSDLYESAKIVLDFLPSVLGDCAVLIFNDWFSYRGDPRFGEQRAFAEWRHEHPECLVTPYHTEGPWSMSFIVNRA